MKKISISIIIITKNSADTLAACLTSAIKLSKDIIVIDDFSSDKTREITQKFNARLFEKHSNNLALQRLFGISRAQGDWIFVLDSDEIIPEKLRNEIKRKITKKYDAFFIPYQNHFLGKKLFNGGESYKILRLFRKGKVKLVNLLLHEKFLPLNENYSTLDSKILHYSYRSILQVYRKFTKYAFMSAKQKSFDNEKTSLKKIILYPMHMFWERFINSKGYKDGRLRIILDLGFAYMEFLTYLLLFFLKKKQKSNTT